MSLTVVSRPRWGSSQSDPPGAPIGRVATAIEHHSYRPNYPGIISPADERAAVRAIQRYHVQTNGWDDIGYQFLIFQSGRVYVGRGWGRSGAHTVGMNGSSVSFCFVIDGDSHLPSDAAWQANYEVIQRGVRLGHIAPGYEVNGHTDYAAKSCPGRRVHPLIDRKLEGAAPTPTTEEGLFMGVEFEDKKELGEFIRKQTHKSVLWLLTGRKIGGGGRTISGRVTENNQMLRGLSAESDALPGIVRDAVASVDADVDEDALARAIVAEFLDGEQTA